MKLEKTNEQLLIELENQLKDMNLASEFMADEEADNMVLISRADAEQIILSLKSNQLQATVDELKKRCEELEKDLNLPLIRKAIEFGTDLEAGNIQMDYKKYKTWEDQFVATCGLDNLLTNERK